MPIPLTVAWFSQFPVEWLPDAPEWVRQLPLEHPSSWQRVLLEELENTAGLKLHILVLRRQFEASRSFDRNGVTFHLIKTPPASRAPSFFWVDTLLIRRKLAGIRPDVIHAWGTERGGALIASRLAYPSVVTIQGLMSWYAQVIPLNAYSRFASWLERYSLPKLRLVSTESAFSVNWVRTHFPGPEVFQIEHAPASHFHKIVRNPATHPFRFLFVGTFDYRKGADLLMGALAQLEQEIDFELTVVGRLSGAFAEEMRRSIPKELWQRVCFRPDLTPSEVADELARATMLIFPTRADTSPNAVKEAVVAGVPVIGSNVGGIPDYVFPERNGLLFPPGDTSALATSIRTACRHPLFQTGQVEADSLSRVRAYLSPKRMGERFLEIYRHAKSARAAEV